MKTNQLFGKFLYGITFLLVLPAGIWFWAKYTAPIINLPVMESKILGTGLIIAGGLLLLWGMFALMHYGKGLPMNGYPPPVFVTKGPYRLFRHPIYWGFGMTMTGWFIYTGSHSGIWLVSPLTILGMAALVLGYEEIDLKQRFPDQKLITVLDLPEKSLKSPDIRDRFAAMVRIVLLLLFSNFLIEKLVGNTSPFIQFPFDFYQPLQNRYLPFLSFIFVMTTPFILKRKDLLREWALSGVLAISFQLFIALLYPSFGAQYLPTQEQFLLTTPIFLILISLNAMFRRSLKTAILAAVIASILVIILLANSRSGVLHFVSSILIFLLAANYIRIWIFLKRGSERIANSWKEWVFGKVRVINHGFYVGFGTFFGLLLAGTLAGKAYVWALLVFTVLVTIFAALWAQIIEGSAKLKRPFGYYGGVVGILFGSVAVWAMGLNGWVIIGVGSVVMPWVQAIGRLRCLVNGCCHGRPCNSIYIGIRYFHPRSRVCTISGLKGELIHPTQLYSILWLFFVGIFLFTLWNKSGISIPLIFGLYLILTSLGRFVEEAYRGEVQTPGVMGLHLYQWTAVISVIAGILMTLIRVEPAVFSPGFCWESVVVAGIGGFFIFFAMGVDFPYSNVRFSRLV